MLEEVTLGNPEEASGAEYGLVPGMEEWVTASLFGDIWGRPGLEKKVRSMATMSALCVLGRLPQLKGHVAWALNLGWSREEIGELFLHLVYLLWAARLLKCTRGGQRGFRRAGLPQADLIENSSRRKR